MFFASPVSISSILTFSFNTRLAAYYSRHLLFIQAATCLFYNNSNFLSNKKIISKTKTSNAIRVSVTRRSWNDVQVQNQIYTSCRLCKKYWSVTVFFSLITPATCIVMCFTLPIRSRKTFTSTPRVVRYTNIELWLGNGLDERYGIEKIVLQDINEPVKKPEPLAQRSDSALLVTVSCRENTLNAFQIAPSTGIARKKKLINLRQNINTPFTLASYTHRWRHIKYDIHDVRMSQTKNLLILQCYDDQVGN